MVEPIESGAEYVELKTVGSVPSVVYRSAETPAPAPSLAASVTVTGLVVYQPDEHAAALHCAEVVGAAESAVTVKDVASESSPAPFVVWTLFGSLGSAAPAAKLYAPPVSRYQPVPFTGSSCSRRCRTGRQSSSG